MNTWTDAEVDKMKSAYYQAKEVKCPQCGNNVIVKKQEGEEYLKKKYVNTHFFLNFTCTGCGIWDTKTYKKSP